MTLEICSRLSSGHYEIEQLAISPCGSGASYISAL